MPRQKKDAKILNIKLAREISNSWNSFAKNQEYLKLLLQKKIYRNILRNISVDWKKSAHFSNKNI